MVRDSSGKRVFGKAAAKVERQKKARTRQRAIEQDIKRKQSFIVTTSNNEKVIRTVIPNRVVIDSTEKVTPFVQTIRGKTRIQAITGGEIKKVRIIDKKTGIIRGKPRIKKEPKEVKRLIFVTETQKQFFTRGFGKKTEVKPQDLPSGLTKEEFKRRLEAGRPKTVLPVRELIDVSNKAVTLQTRAANAGDKKLARKLSKAKKKDLVVLEIQVKKAEAKKKKAIKDLQRILTRTEQLDKRYDARANKVLSKVVSDKTFTRRVSKKTAIKLSKWTNPLIVFFEFGALGAAGIRAEQAGVINTKEIIKATGKKAGKVAKENLTLNYYIATGQTKKANKIINKQLGIVKKAGKKTLTFAKTEEGLSTIIALALAAGITTGALQKGLKVVGKGAKRTIKVSPKLARDIKKGLKPLLKSKKGSKNINELGRLLRKRAAKQAGKVSKSKILVKKKPKPKPKVFKRKTKKIPKGAKEGDKVIIGKDTYNIVSIDQPVGNQVLKVLQLQKVKKVVKQKAKQVLKTKSKQKTKQKAKQILIQELKTKQLTRQKQRLEIKALPVLIPKQKQKLRLKQELALTTKQKQEQKNKIVPISVIISKQKVLQIPTIKPLQKQKIQQIPKTALIPETTPLITQETILKLKEIRIKQKKSFKPPKLPKIKLKSLKQKKIKTKKTKKKQITLFTPTLIRPKKKRKEQLFTPIKELFTGIERR
jgi:hypothetical protein